MTFDEALAIVLDIEGGYSDDKHDPGRATNLGVTQKTLSAYRGYRVTKEEVQNLTPAEAKEVYRTLYWKLCRCDELPGVLKLAVFDCAVNQGAGRAAKILQRVVGAKRDGKIGPITVVTVWSRDPVAVLTDFMARRSLHYSSLPTLVRYGFGWFRRLFKIHRLSITAAT